MKFKVGDKLLGTYDLINLGARSGKYYSIVDVSDPDIIYVRMDGVTCFFVSLHYENLPYLWRYFNRVEFINRNRIEKLKRIEYET